MNMHEKLDYSNLSAVELKAIMLCQMNFEKKEGDALYLPLPYLGETIVTLAEIFESYPSEKLYVLRNLHDELLAANKHLLQLAPNPPSFNPEEIVASLTNDEIIDGLLKNSIVISLVETLTYFQKVVAERINDIENGVLKGVNNGSIN